MESVANGDCKYGVVPIENSIEGSVTLTLDSMIHNFDLKIRNEIVIPINHNLLAAHDMAVESVSDVYSHSQALGQCQPYLERHGMTPHYTLSTAAAAKQVAESGEGAAIGTLKAAELYGLKVIDRNIQEKFNNQTRFIVLDNEDSPMSGNDKTSVAFSLYEDRPGGLFWLLGIFARENINLTKIESRPSKEGLGHYIFFVDFEGHRMDWIARLPFSRFWDLIQFIQTNFSNDFFMYKIWFFHCFFFIFIFLINFSLSRIFYLF